MRPRAGSGPISRSVSRGVRRPVCRPVWRPVSRPVSRLRRLLVAVVVLVAVGGPAGCSLPVGDAEAEQARSGSVRQQAPDVPVDGPTRRSAAERAARVAGVSVLREWDRRRAAAWRRGDEAALARLYAHGSSAGRSDVRLLRAYAARGLVVRRLVTQVFAVRVLHRREDRLRLSVLDRVAGGVLSDGARSRPLPSTPPVNRTVQFRRTPSGWVVAQLSDSATAPPGARP